MGIFLCASYQDPYYSIISMYITFSCFLCFPSCVCCPILPEVLISSPTASPSMVQLIIKSRKLLSLKTIFLVDATMSCPAIDISSTSVSVRAFIIKEKLDTYRSRAWSNERLHDEICKERGRRWRFPAKVSRTYMLFCNKNMKVRLHPMIIRNMSYWVQNIIEDKKNAQKHCTQ